MRSVAGSRFAVVGSPGGTPARVCAGRGGGMGLSPLGLGARSLLDLTGRVLALPPSSKTSESARKHALRVMPGLRSIPRYP